MQESFEISPIWELVSDQVMGGVSAGSLSRETLSGRTATRLLGRVSLENNGGFLQMAFDLTPDDRPADLSNWHGIEIDAFGNDQDYDVRLRTSQLTRPWQSFRASSLVPRSWSTLRFPFDAFTAHRTDHVLDVGLLRRVGILGVGRAFDVDIAVSAIRFFR